MTTPNLSVLTARDIDDYIDLEELFRTEQQLDDIVVPGHQRSQQQIRVSSLRRGNGGVNLTKLHTNDEQITGYRCNRYMC
jgi:hypothetical protein